MNLHTGVAISLQTLLRLECKFTPSRLTDPIKYAIHSIGLFHQKFSSLTMNTNSTDLLNKLRRRVFQTARLMAQGNSALEVSKIMGIKEESVNCYLDDFYPTAVKITNFDNFRFMHLPHLFFRLGKIELLYHDRDFAKSPELIKAATKYPRELKAAWHAARGLRNLEIEALMGTAPGVAKLSLERCYKRWGELLCEPAFSRIHLVSLFYRLGKLKVLFPKIGLMPPEHSSQEIDTRLTPQEYLVARHAAQGMGDKHIADALHINIREVEGRLQSVYQKGKVFLNDPLFGRVRLVHLFCRLGQLDLLQFDSKFTELDVFPRVRQVASLIGKGFGNRKISETLPITEGTVDKYRQMFYQDVRQQTGQSEMTGVLTAHIMLRGGGELLYPRITTLSASQLILQ